MTSIERTAYPRFTSALSPQELRTLYDPSDDEREFVLAHAQEAAQQLTLLAFLKSHQYLGYLPAAADIPAQIRSYLCQQFHLPPETELYETKHYRYRYRQLVRAYLQVKPIAMAGRIWSGKRPSRPLTP